MDPEFREVRRVFPAGKFADGWLLLNRGFLLAFNGFTYKRINFLNSHGSSSFSTVEITDIDLGKERIIKDFVSASVMSTLRSVSRAMTELNSSMRVSHSVSSMYT